MEGKEVAVAERREADAMARAAQRMAEAAEKMAEALDRLQGAAFPLRNFSPKRRPTGSRSQRSIVLARSWGVRLRTSRRARKT